MKPDCCQTVVQMHAETFLRLSKSYSFLYLLQQFISHQMELKINRQNIFQAMKQLEVVEKLPRQALQEFCRVFKVNDGGAEGGGMGKALQNKIADIICQQGEGFQDYLQLPKFRTMGHQLNQKLSNVFRRVWQELPAITNREQISQLKKELAELTPNFQTTAQYANFHLKLLQLYKTSLINPAHSQKPTKKETKIKLQANSNQTSLVPNTPNIPNTPPLVSQPQQPNVFNYFPFPPPATYAKVEAQEEETYILNNKQQPQLFEMPRFALQHQPYQQQIEFYPPIDPKHMFPMKKEETRKPVLQNIYSQEQVSNLILRYKQYEFINCVCEGKSQLQEQNNFNCSSCNFSYHFSCLKCIKPSSQELICPICKLRRDTIYCQVIKQPLKFSWFIQEKPDKDLKVELTLEESQQVHQARKKGLFCQIRFLKLDGKKKETKLQGNLPDGGVLSKFTKHSEITLPELYQDKKEPISLQIMLRSDQEKDKDLSSKLYFFGVFLVNIRTVDKIVQDLFLSNQSFPPDYLQPFMEEKGSVLIKLKKEDYAPHLIKYPVRGINCKHAAVFDLKYLLQLLVDLKRDKQTEIHCPVCSTLCPGFLYDSFVTSCIKNYPDYEQKQPEGLSIFHDGEFNWMYGQQQEQQEGAEVDGDGDIDGEEQGEQNGEGNQLEDPASSGHELQT